MLLVRQPSGTVTLVFTDVEGSTALLGELGTEAYRAALAEHRRIVREAFAAHAGYEVDDAGDGLFNVSPASRPASDATKTRFGSMGPSTRR